MPGECNCTRCKGTILPEADRYCKQCYTIEVVRQEDLRKEVGRYRVRLEDNIAQAEKMGLKLTIKKP